MSNRFALERYLRWGVERMLTASFMDGLQAGLAELRRPVALLFDTYEEMEGQDDWVCRTFGRPACPTACAWGDLGRNELHRVNFDWVIWGTRSTPYPCPNWTKSTPKRTCATSG